MKCNKITALVLSIVMSLLLMIPSIVVLADETSVPSETQMAESTETQETKPTEKKAPKATEKQEPKVTETPETKETEKSELEATETQETKVSETQEPKETEKQEPKENEKPETEEPTRPSDDEEKETAVEGTLPSVTARNKKKMASSSGTFDNLSWSYDEATKTLSITGKGEMLNFNHGATPWEQYVDSIESIVIGEGVTKISKYVFSGYENVVNVTVPGSVITIEDGAFTRCSKLSNLTLGEGIIGLREAAFSDCTSLTSVKIPLSVQWLEDWCFADCSSLASVTLTRAVYDDCDSTVFTGCPVKSSFGFIFISPDTAHTITVNSGSSNVTSASSGTSITITANAAPAGKVFDKWIVNSGNVSLSNISSLTTTFTMPAENVEVTATYKDAEYIIKVNSGSATPATATIGTIINLTANAAPTGKEFDKWIVNFGNVSLTNISSSTTTFTMPAENVEVTATYKDAEYTIKVNSGSATPATAMAGTLIILTANDAPSGKVFDKWIVNSGSISLSNFLSSTTTFTMPAGNVEVTATYKNVPSGNFVVKVNNGFATPSTSAPGLVVNVKANDALDGMEFDKWEVVSGTVIFANASSETTFFVMPAENVEITAKYKSSLSVKGKTATVKYSKLKKKNQTLAVSKVLTFVDKGQGQLTYAKISGNSKILINKTTGTITVKKKLKKKTYTVKVKVMASGNESCNPSGWKTVTFKIKVK